jgi:acyl-coenzyme A thioesterase PaaI-like protein
MATAADLDLPPWAADFASEPSLTCPSWLRYWEGTDGQAQVHGSDSVIALLHGESAEPALRGATFFLEHETRMVHALWPLGRRVCGHPGIVHGGVTALLLDEAFGQAYWTFVWPTRGKGFTANLTVDYKAPVPAGEWISTSVELLSVEGRKVRLQATVSQRPRGQGTLYATASCLFIVARKEEDNAAPAPAAAATE